LHMAQRIPLPLTVSCFSKIQIGFTFLVPAYLGSPGQRAVKQVLLLLSLLPLASVNADTLAADTMRKIHTWKKLVHCWHWYCVGIAAGKTQCGVAFSKVNVIPVHGQDTFRPCCLRLIHVYSLCKT